ncbi:MAG: CDP-alcohol phosphatidyltransferase family protein [Hydrogenophaga sp.]|jgi:phosphatidylglycerophosphate synthase|uniref:CDP-alcohol phosphatidyltransferase family protein n=1 Tax=Hydrogenophaga sp. TaxID=1904254 RepID=UPI00260FBC96|nr:CDP-alcohol phosphatidyltransferase family protein [Hydrogenophaga sp.]MCV0440830.1 CDP-alcohol phosphatidyltransferase family protein [Hydrogenophaga sp.]
MKTATPSHALPAALERDAARDLAAVAVLVAAASVALGTAAGFGADYSAKSALVYTLGAWLVWRGLAAHPHPRFGPANRVTLLRLAAMALMAALVGEAFPRPPLDGAPMAAWALVLIATLTAVLDAADGALARRSGLASAFGARFDMETDAAFTLVLCALVLQAGQAGAWVLAAGLMRYAFVAAARVWPWLGAPLPPSRRRQTVCVVQITALIACLGPIVPPVLASALALSSLALLAISFGIDVQHLARQRATHRET